MGLFDLFKKNNNSDNASTDNGILGPTYLDGLTEHIQNPKGLHSHEWRRRLKATSGHTKFKIKYFGQLHKTFKNLIVRTEFAPALIFAVDVSTGQEILLFDGCKHGYDGLLGDTFTEEQVKNRPATTYYKDKEGGDTFEVVISTHNDINYDAEFGNEVDENAMIEIADGTKLPFETVKRNGYSALQIWVTNDKGKTTEIVSEELA